MFMKSIKSSSYDNDDRNYLAGFLEYVCNKKPKNERIVNNDNNKNVLNIKTIPAFRTPTVQLSTLDLNSLYNIAGYIN